MGLNIVPLVRVNDERASWSYGGFRMFREKLASAVGIDLENMVGFGGDMDWPNDEPLVPLLNHSDCDGELDRSACASVAPRLLAIVATWDNDDYDKSEALDLAAMMQRVAEEDYDRLVFS